MAGRKAPENETPEARFVRLANRRADYVLTGLSGLGNLVGSQYKSTPEQHKKLFDIIRERTDDAEKRLKANSPSAARAGGIL